MVSTFRESTFSLTSTVCTRPVNYSESNSTDISREELAEQIISNFIITCPLPISCDNCKFSFNYNKFPFHYNKIFLSFTYVLSLLQWLLFLCLSISLLWRKRSDHRDKIESEGSSWLNPGGLLALSWQCTGCWNISTCELSLRYKVQNLKGLQGTQSYR